METLWFVLVVFMLTVYVVLDGFDLGAGIIHLIAARCDKERQMILKAIGPVWDGNEVWLIAAGGTLYCAFPPLYAASFSGFYLPLMIVLWLLMLRAIGIEFRSHVDNQIWHDFFDVIFSIASLLLSIFFGAALGNVIRGVPLDKDGYFFEPLWTTFTPGESPGILDWYTVLIGLTSMFVLTSHGATFIAAKTEGELNRRARRYAAIAWPPVVLLTVLGLVATVYIQPRMLDNYRAHWLGLIFPFMVLAGLIGMAYFRAKENDRAAFSSSCLYIIGMLGGAGFGLYPNLLPATTNSAYTLTIYNSAASRYGLGVATVWWSFGIALATGYFIYLYTSFRGKVRLDDGH